MISERRVKNRRGWISIEGVEATKIFRFKFRTWAAAAWIRLITALGSLKRKNQRRDLCNRQSTPHLSTFLQHYATEQNKKQKLSLTEREGKGEEIASHKLPCASCHKASEKNRLGELQTMVDRCGKWIYFNSNNKWFWYFIYFKTAIK